MSYKVNAVKHKPDYYKKSIPALASAPTTPKTGDMYFNTTNSKIYIWYNAQWVVIHNVI
jgi:hypothetical protein